MDPGTTIGLVIALGTLFVTLWLGLARLRHERTLADLDDARSILGDGAADLKRIGDALDDLEVKLAPALALREDEYRPQAERLLAECRELFRETQTVQGGLRIRFPRDSKLVVSFDHALIEAFAVTLEIEQRVLSPKKDRPESEGKMRDSRQGFEEKRDRYLALAQRSVGSALPA